MKNFTPTPICFFVLHLIPMQVSAAPADLDNDGIPNNVEIAFGLDPNNPIDANLDFDSDSWSNLDEYRFGTGINDDTSDPSQIENPHQKVFANDGDEKDEFGHVVSISGNTAVIGSALNDINGTDSGAVYVFSLEDGIWVQQERLVSSDLAENDKFGSSVAIFEDNIVVGAPGNDDNGSNSGSAYIFTRENNSWIEQEKILSSTPAIERQFGLDVAITNNLIAVGTNIIYVEVYEKQNDNWTFQQRVNGLSSGKKSLAISADTLLVGASLNPPSGSVIYFRLVNGNWNQLQVIQVGDTSPSDFFGSSLDFHENILIVGAPRDEEFMHNSGAAYIYDRSRSGTWDFVEKLTPSDIAQNDEFGHSVSLDSNFIAISSKEDNNVNGVSAGATYIYTQGTDGNWTERQKLLAADGSLQDRFNTVALSGSNLVVGARWDDDSGIDSGSAYFFDLKSLLPNILNSQKIPLIGDFGFLTLFIVLGIIGIYVMHKKCKNHYN